MGKDSRKSTSKKLNNSPLIRQICYLLKDWDVKVMSYVMVVVVMIAVIAATVAWFFYLKAVAVSNMRFNTAACESLKVEIKPSTDEGGTTGDFVELKQGDDDSVFAELDMPLFDNVENYEVSVGSTQEEATGTKRVSKMAPGVYGSLTIRLTPLNKEIDHYRINPVALFTYTDGTSDKTSSDGSVKESEDNKVLQALAKGHIQFYKDRQEILEENKSSGTITVGTETEAKAIEEYTHNQKYVFYNLLDSDTPLEGELPWNDESDEGTPTVVTVYWYWPYEYDNLSKEIKDSLALPAEGLSSIVTDTTRLQYFDIDKMQEIVDNNISWNETQLYDYGDTRIGTYVKSIKVHLKVDGYHAEGIQNQTTE